jgi:hypothetical protein
MAISYASCAIFIVASLVFSHLTRADIAVIQNNTRATQLLLQDRVGESLFSSYRSALVNQLNQSTLQNGPISAQCLADLIKIKDNPSEIFKCK